MEQTSRYQKPLSPSDLEGQGLFDLVNQVSLSYFGQAFTHQVSWNRRLRSTGGRYMTRTGNIELNPRVLDLLGMEIFLGVIKHELCHYHLHQAGRGYRHRDRDFKALLAQVQGLAYVPRMDPAPYCYHCQACGQIYQRYRPIQVSRYRCGKCGRGSLSLAQE